MFTVSVFSQELLEKSITSNANQFIVELDNIDHIDVFNSKTDKQIEVKAEGELNQTDFSLIEKNGIVYIKGLELNEIDDEDPDKLCQIEPDYTSYELYIPENCELFVSILQGNFYADNFKGELNITMEDGIIKLGGMEGSAKLKLNSGSVYVKRIENTGIDAKTNLGRLITDFNDEGIYENSKQIVKNIGNASKSLLIKATMANIYLNASKD